ncbi:MAG TPA: hypothetical protein VHI93_01450, partial [Candidatus Thermoplasmatota archaeon]|nr:hypothetical protein [Candidatus Thermoplasmatota archaeon]
MAGPPLRVLLLPLALVLAAVPADAGDADPRLLQVRTEGEPAATHNDPRVGCSFILEGFQAATSRGTYSIQAWPPTGDKRVVLAGNWTAHHADGGEGGHSHSHHFTVGPLALPSGHYRASVGNALEGTKTKAFWVDCGGTPPPPCDGALALTGHHVLLDGVAYGTLREAPLREGDEVTVVFALKGCGAMRLSLASYAAAGGPGLAQQVLFDRDTGTFVEGLHTLDVVVAPCPFQVAFAFGAVLEPLEPPNGTYEA